MDSAASLLSPRSSPTSPFSFSPLPSPRSLSPSSPSSSASSFTFSPLPSPRSLSPSSSSACSFTFSPLPSPRPFSTSAPLRSVTGFPDLDSSSSSFLWGSHKPFSTLLEPPPAPRFRPPAVNVSNYTTTSEPSPKQWPGTEWAPSPRRTHYSLLGVSPSTSPRDIRLAYCKLALQYHPDVNPLHQLDTSTKIFAEINEAYSTLSDPQKKACYDLKLALESPAGAATGAAMASPPSHHHHGSPSPRNYTDVATGRVYPSMNSFYREWRRAHT